MFYRLLNLVSEIRIPPDAGDFCLMDRRVVQEVLSFNPMTGFIRGIRAWVGFRQTAIEYDRDARIAGKPKFGWQKLFALAMDGWFSFSRRPIRMILGTGLTVLVLTGLFLLACGLSWLANGIIPGESVLTIGVLGLVGILGGGNLIAISLIGEYVLRLYESGQGRPAAIISEMVADDSGNGRIDEGLPFRTVDRRSTLSKRKAA